MRVGIILNAGMKLSAGFPHASGGLIFENLNAGRMTGLCFRGNTLREDVHISRRSLKGLKEKFPCMGITIHCIYGNTQIQDMGVFPMRVGIIPPRVCFSGFRICFPHASGDNPVFVGAM